MVTPKPPLWQLEGGCPPPPHATPPSKGCSGDQELHFGGLASMGVGGIFVNAAYKSFISISNCGLLIGAGYFLKEITPNSK